MKTKKKKKEGPTLVHKPMQYYTLFCFVIFSPTWNHRNHVSRPKGGTSENHRALEKQA
jgi:hypothetical protein